MIGTFFECSLVDASNIVIPDSVTTIATLFGGCYNLTKAPSIPSSVTNMSWAFSDCVNLTSISELPKGVTNISGTFF